MIQKVNGTKVMVMVRERPSYDEVQQAIDSRLPLQLQVARYAQSVESTGSFELVDVRKLRGTQDDFQFSGSVVGVDVESDPNNNGSVVVYVKAGVAKVRVDSNGADIQFLIYLSVHII